jgi:hypothetical protein
MHSRVSTISTDALGISGSGGAGGAIVDSGLFLAVSDVVGHGFCCDLGAGVILNHRGGRYRHQKTQSLAAILRGAMCPLRLRPARHAGSVSGMRGDSAKTTNRFQVNEHLLRLKDSKKKTGTEITEDTENLAQAAPATQRILPRRREGREVTRS